MKIKSPNHPVGGFFCSVGTGLPDGPSKFFGYEESFFTFLICRK